MAGWVGNVYKKWRTTRGRSNYMDKWYMGFGGSGFTRQQNFLLKRDLDPASNDNTPMFLNKED